jgi:hydrogenase expression/formation protein HypC
MCLAVPGKLIEMFGDDPLTREGRVSFAGIVKKVNLAYLPEAVIGDYVLVHAGFALTIVDEDEALKTLDYLAEFEPEDLR